MHNLIEKLYKFKGHNVTLEDNLLYVHDSPISEQLPYIVNVTADYVLIKDEIQQRQSYVFLKNLSGIVFLN